MSVEFKDHFSKHASIYQKFRPNYPDSLFKYLSSLAPDRELAWDCGTGNGQAAQGLIKYFKNVHASDPSKSQLNFVRSHPGITYKLEPAEHSSLNDNSVDLLTVAQALHWFSLEKFYSEAKRVLKQKGIIAVWTYNLPTISRQIDSIVNHLHNVELDPFWKNENRLVDKRYKTIPFPFNELTSPSFKIKKEISVEDLLGLIRSWSAVQRYISEKNLDPVELIEEDIGNIWAEGPDRKLATWNLVLKIGINTANNPE